MVRHAVIPAAGMGTRMLPAAKAIPKEMLPVLDRPTIQYVMEEIAGAGISEAVLVITRGKRAIEEHFADDAELNAHLARSGKRELLRSVEAIVARVKISAVEQAQQRGLGDAVYQAKEQVGENSFACLLGDTIFGSAKGGPLPTEELIKAHSTLGTTVIGLEEVPADRVQRYGIVGGEMIGDGVMKIDRLMEKPTAAEAPSRYAIAARYVLTPAIFSCLEETMPGKGGEIQLTDALKLLLKREAIHGVVLSAERFDIGNPIDWLKTNLVLAMRDPVLRRELAPLLAELLRRGE